MSFLGYQVQGYHEANNHSLLIPVPLSFSLRFLPKQLADKSQKQDGFQGFLLFADNLLLTLFGQKGKAYNSAPFLLKGSPIFRFKSNADEPVTKTVVSGMVSTISLRLAPIFGIFCASSTNRKS